jgi:prepilin-type N-terminal cleavage/methylation domain-containing protein
MSTDPILLAGAGGALSGAGAITINGDEYTFSYANGTLQNIVFPDGRKTQWRFESAGTDQSRLTLTQESGWWRSWVYNDNETVFAYVRVPGAPVARPPEEMTVTRPLGRQTVLSRDADDNLSEMVAPGGVIRRFEWDSRYRLTAIKDGANDVLLNWFVKVVILCGNFFTHFIIMKAPTKTISQNQFKPKSKEQGFTLIELLVVIAIIALLASIIIVSLQDARDRAKNSKKNQMVVQYINALELYRSEHPEQGYPDYGNINNGIYYCLGVPTGQTCQGNLSNGNSNLISELEKYIPGVPADDVITNTTNAYGNLLDYKGCYCLWEARLCVSAEE